MRGCVPVCAAPGKCRGGLVLGAYRAGCKGWDSHRNDLVTGKLTAQGLPRGVDTLVKEARLVDFDTCIVDRASGDRQGDALQQREVDPGRSTAAPGVRRNDP